MGDYTNRRPQGYDAEQVLLTSGTVTANIAAGAGNSNEVAIGENMNLEVVAQVTGTVSGTSPTLDLKIQEATAAGGSYSDVAGGAFTQITATDAFERISIVTTKEYIAAVATVGGTTPSFGGTTVYIVS